MMTLQTYTLMHNIEARPPATVAQLAEQRFCKPQVVGSSPTGGSSRLDLQDRRTQPNYNLKFNLYYKNRPLRSVNVFARRADIGSSTASKYSTIIETYGFISNIKKYHTRALVRYNTNMT